MAGDQTAAIATHIGNNKIKLFGAALAAGKIISNTYNSTTNLTTVIAVTPSTTWTTSWSNGIPNSSLEVIIDGTYSTITNGAFSAKKLTVNSSKVLTIDSFTNVTVQNEVVNNGTLVLENNANLIQVNNVANTGNVVVKRSSNSLYRLDYTLWSSPVAGQNLVAFSPLTSQSPIRFYNYDSNVNKYIAITNPTTTNFTVGLGYLIRMPNEDPLSGYDTGVTPLSYNGIFTGVLNNGNIQITLSDFGSKYNLVGNPYSSVIDAELFLSANSSSIENTLYFWRKTNGSSGSAYAMYTQGGGTTTEPGIPAPNGKIQVGQGFFVQAKLAVTVANFFSNTMREALPSSTQFYKTKKVLEKDRLWLNLTNRTGVFSQTLVAYIADAATGLDKYDGKYIDDSPIALTSNINNEEYTIQGRPAFDASDVVPLNFKTDVAGDYTIAIDHSEGVFAAGQSVILTDATTGTETDLTTSSYTFTAATGSASSRFSLKYQKTLKVDASVANNNSVTVYKNKGTLYVNSGVSAIANIKVFDIQGRLIVEQKDVKSNTATINNLKDLHQVLVVQVTSEDNKVVNKKVVN